jgi:signal recognition particle subunit SRP72
MQVLRLDPTDKDALQTKLSLLLQTEQYAAALTLADSAEHAFEFGRAYSLYRLHREHEAAAVLDDIKASAGSTRGVNHLEAQLVRPITVPSLVHIFFISELHFAEL